MSGPKAASIPVAVHLDHGIRFPAGIEKFTQLLYFSERGGNHFLPRKTGIYRHDHRAVYIIQNVFQYADGGGGVQRRKGFCALRFYGGKHLLQMRRGFGVNRNDIAFSEVEPR